MCEEFFTILEYVLSENRSRNAKIAVTQPPPEKSNGFTRKIGWFCVKGKVILPMTMGISLEISPEIQRLKRNFSTTEKLNKNVIE